MGAVAMWDAQTAIYAAMRADASLSTYQIYDGAVPQHITPTFPYIVIGDANETGADLLNRIGRDLAFVIHVWSRYQGQKEVKQIMNLICRVIDRTTTLQTADWWFPIVRLESAQSLMEDDDQYHGIITLRIMGQPRT